MSRQSRTCIISLRWKSGPEGGKNRKKIRKACGGDDENLEGYVLIWGFCTGTIRRARLGK